MTSLIAKLETDATLRARAVLILSRAMGAVAMLAAAAVGYLSWVV